MPSVQPLGPGAAKLSKKVKRRRLNARLRKILTPKNAVMVLNELKAGVLYSFVPQPNVLTQPMFVANAAFDKKNFRGQGLSKPLAKQNAAENALKAMLAEKILVAVAAEEAPAPANGEDPMDSLDDETATAEDEIPWRHLASFALYKLFVDWQNKPVPLNKAAGKSKVKHSPMKKMPPNPTARDPVMLLSQLLPSTKFSEIARVGNPPNLTFTMGTVVQGVTYTGVAKNKKDAKKEAAKAAITGCFKIKYQ